MLPVSVTKLLRRGTSGKGHDEAGQREDVHRGRDDETILSDPVYQKAEGKDGEGKGYGIAGKGVAHLGIAG